MSDPRLAELPDPFGAHQAIYARAAHEILSRQHSDTLMAPLVANSLLHVNSKLQWAQFLGGSLNQYLKIGASGLEWTTLSLVHDLLSATHSDVTAAAVQLGDLVTGQGSPAKWGRKGKGTIGDFLSMLDANNPGWGRKIGDGTNYTEWSSAGRQTMVGTARVLDEKILYANNSDLYLPSTLPAASSEINPGASGSIQTRVYSFSSTSTVNAEFIWGTPHNIDSSYAITLRLGWKPASGWTSGNFYWKIDYLLKAVTDPINTGTPTTISVDVTPANANNMLNSAFTTTIASVGPDQVLMGRLYRDVTLDNGNANGLVMMLKIEHALNSLGKVVV